MESSRRYYFQSFPPQQKCRRPLFQLLFFIFQPTFLNIGLQQILFLGNDTGLYAYSIVLIRTICGSCSQSFLYICSLIVFITFSVLNRSFTVYSFSQQRYFLIWFSICAFVGCGGLLSNDHGVLQLPVIEKNEKNYFCEWTVKPNVETKKIIIKIDKLIADNSYASCQ